MDDPGPLPPVSPFTRLARAHLAAAASDAMIAVALAGSVFFSIDPSAARWRVALYLVLTAAPFAVVTPLIGPLVDRIRGGRRGMILFTVVGRGVLAYLMFLYIDGLALFPIVFGVLVLQKSYSVAKSAVVPKLVRSDSDFVEANSKLTLLSAVGSVVGATLGGLVLLGGSSWPAAAAVVSFTLTLVLAVQVPRIAVAPIPTTPDERADLRGAGIVIAASAMGMLRASVGFMTFLLAFEFRGGDEGVATEGVGRGVGAAVGVARQQDIFGNPGAPAWHYVAVLFCASGGALIGARLAPRLRRSVVEERIISGVLFNALIGTVLAGWIGSVVGAMLAAMVIAGSSGLAKLAFDSLVQRDAPGANHGRSFARFEGRFQLFWALGAFLPVALPMPIEIGYIAMAAGVGVGLVVYLTGTREARRFQRQTTPEEPDRPDGQLGFWPRGAQQAGEDRKTDGGD